MAMQILPASAGVQWLTMGVNLVLRNLLPSLLVGLLVVVVDVIAEYIPILGPLAVLLLFPCLLAGILSVFRDIDNGKASSLEGFLYPAKTQTAPLLALGAIYSAVAIVAVIVIAVILYSIFGTELVALLDSLTDNDINDQNVLEFLRFLMVAFPFFLVFFAILLMFIWFSPFLITWHGMPVIEAVRTSFSACLKNWQAFLVNGIVVGIGFIVIALVLSLIVAVANPNETAIALVLTLLLSPFMYAIHYYSCKTIFPDEDPAMK